MEQLKNKIALITGGNSGIGYATAKEFISQGAKVIITGRRKEAIEKAAQEIGAIAFVADQANLQHTDLLRNEVENQFGKVDILFINAGIMGTLELIENQTAENYDNVMNINVRGAYFTLSKLIPLLNDGASVVMLSSNTAIMHSPNSSIYQASKAALNSIAKTAAAELAPRRIRVNLVSPGPIKTDIIAKSGFNEATVKSIKDHLVNEAIPLKKMGEPEDVAKLVRYLCEESANYITGAEIIIDGGMTL
ncbi:glucose 1-dehydrogenase [Parabacteroides sp. Marseille-P3160]|uniref:glucose 1-dehydrogenase n=1 Tax=Parabacteroides sp. Marseille-P3160 TaxID=1917887 RepID=UPI0009BADAE3|nr:glucose 1-dehydrogenase [Parabacteroides sp. Marseille-P3160]